MWRINEHDLEHRSHAVIRLDVHLPRAFKQQIQDSENFLPEDLTDVGQKGSTLNAWFRLNQRLKEAKRTDFPLYLRTPEAFVFNSSTSEFTDMKRYEKRIGRMYQVSPQQPELYHLRYSKKIVKNYFFLGYYFQR